MTRERRRQLEARIVARRASQRHEPEIMFATEGDLLDAIDMPDTEDETPARRKERETVEDDDATVAA
jgi:hypothetical protein